MEQHCLWLQRLNESGAFEQAGPAKAPIYPPPPTSHMWPTLHYAFKPKLVNGHEKKAYILALLGRWIKQHNGRWHKKAAAAVKYGTQSQAGSSHSPAALFGKNTKRDRSFPPPSVCRRQSKNTNYPNAGRARQDPKSFLGARWSKQNQTQIIQILGSDS